MVIAVVYFVVALTAAVMFGRTLDRRLQGPRLRAAWDGLTAEARCTGVRTEEITDVEGVPMVHSHPALEFRTPDGRTVRFEERQAQLDVKQGGFVTVYYGEHEPESATARTPSFVPRHVKTLVTGVGGTFALVTAVVLAGVL
ncbi:DUF3592 domain-containing protein [Streptomyces sp. NBC_01022]|uniref:DUF3592 domain-containing protein n=1 Tax=Streptomyces sp. NBC_01022 TaxID=2903723 RepID=UPI002DDA8265|nr:DUF3592 domain-containing protein [Streptomyces sp. NBC_01022]WRZ79423.1 DUF3592 domain-containing protein [Streptomyces sp. NBC_01022]WRZ86253.1 DUF3592 domain-containing protein [Streptomyces sp. NBC_01022]